ncbi:MAG: xseA [Ignavibacteria bacterium]|nr:xseA [Ignavibacteria bacterium]
MSVEQQVVTVSQLTDTIALLLEEGIGIASVQGEISNYKLHSSGHRYFSLKDENAQISCVLWRGRTLNFQPTDGMKVVVKGTLSVYPPRGQYQLDCISLSPLGTGDLFLAFEALKQKLEQKGYFDSDRKRELPELPLSIGVATSPTGAAVRDILSTIERRFPNVTVYFRPTLVQGDGASEDIVAAIEELNRTPASILIIGRGGGSLEDLWAFNTEPVADAIFHSSKPIISAVGHETDFTISDFVADIRAATPTAAAELATPRTLQDLLGYIDYQSESAERSILGKLKDFRNILDSAGNKVAERRLLDKIRIHEQKFDDLEMTLNRIVTHSLTGMHQHLQSMESQCRLLYPLSPLIRGFAVPMSGGKPIPKSESLKSYTRIELMRDFETALVKVEKILPKKMF